MILFFYNTSCEKEYIRKNYTGTFNFTIYSYVEIDNGTYHSSTIDTFVYRGTIVYDNKKDILEISYLPGYTLNCSIDKDGKITTDISSLPAVFGGFINENEIKFSSESEFDQYAGATYTDRVIGKRH